MVVRFEHMWTAIPLLLIPIAFVIVMMGIIKIWMVGAPVKHRPFPMYSLHVMRDLPPDKPYTTSRSAGGGGGGKPQYPAPPGTVTHGRPVSTHALPFMKTGASSRMQSGANTPGGQSLYSMGGGGGTMNKPRQWQGKFL